MQDETIQQIRAEVERQRDDILKFFREIVAIPSMDSQIEAVGKRIQEEMLKLGFKSAWFDQMGNTVGVIGDGPRVLLYDSHIDTVGANLSEWQHDPWQGKEEDGILYALGSVDEKCSTPGMIYGLSMAHRMGLLDGWTAYYFGNIEEWCDGIACQALVEVRRNPARFCRHRRTDPATCLSRAQGSRRDADRGQGQERTRRQQPSGRERHLQAVAHHRRHSRHGAGVGR